jgi:hypothetical protein
MNIVGMQMQIVPYHSAVFVAHELLKDLLRHSLLDALAAKVMTKGMETSACGVTADVS